MTTIKCTRRTCTETATGRVLVPTFPTSDEKDAYDTTTAPLCDRHQIAMCIGLRRQLNHTAPYGHKRAIGRPFAVPLDHEARMAEARRLGEELRS